jgi:hypothetical protein
MLLVRHAPGAVEGDEGDGAAVSLHLDDDAPRALVDAELRLRPLAAQASDQPCLIGGELELERHAITIGTDAEVLTKIRLVLAQDRVKRS